MLKQVLFYLLLLTTTARFVDMLYVLLRQDTNLPVVVFCVTTLMIAYGALLVFRKFFTGIRIKQLLAFYMVQTGLIVFNIAFVAITCPLEILPSETFIVGTFLDVIINVILIGFTMRRMRSGYAPAFQNTNRKGHMNRV